MLYICVSVYMCLLVTNSSGFLMSSDLLKKSLCRVAYCCALGGIGVVWVDKCMDLPCFPAAGCLKNKVTGWEKKDLRVLVLRKGSCMNHLWSGCLQLCSCQFAAAYNKTSRVLGVAVRHRKAQVCVPCFCFHAVGSASMLQSAGAGQPPAAWAGQAVAALVLSLGDVVLSAGVEPKRGACPLFEQEAGFPLHPQHARTLPAPLVCVHLRHHLKEQLKMMNAVFRRARFECWCSGAACCTSSPIPALLREPASFIYLVVVSSVSVCLICLCVRF